MTRDRPRSRRPSVSSVYDGLNAFSNDFILSASERYVVVRSAALRQRSWKESHHDLLEGVDRAVVCALDKRGMGQAVPPLNPHADSVHGTNKAAPSLTIEQSSSGSV